MPMPIAGLQRAGGVLDLALVSAAGAGRDADITVTGSQALTVQALMMLATGIRCSLGRAERARGALTDAASLRARRLQAGTLADAKAKAERLLSDAPHGVAVSISPAGGGRPTRPSPRWRA